MTWRMSCLFWEPQLMSWLMEPYTGSLDRRKRHFNSHLNSWRMGVSCASGRVKGRWHCLWTMLQVAEKQCSDHCNRMLCFAQYLWDQGRGKPCGEVDLLRSSSSQQGKPQRHKDPWECSQGYVLFIVWVWQLNMGGCWNADTESTGVLCVGGWNLTFPLCFCQHPTNYSTVFQRFSVLKAMMTHNGCTVNGCIMKQ